MSDGRFIVNCNDSRCDESGIYTSSSKEALSAVFFLLVCFKSELICSELL